MTYCGIYQLINSKQGKAINGTSFIQVSKIYTHPLLSIGFLDQNNVGEPGGVVYAPYEISLQQLVDFYLNGFVALYVKHFLFILNRSIFNQCAHTLVNAWHILMQLSKDVSIFL